MGILYNENLDKQLDNNGTEGVAPASNPNWFAGTGAEIKRGASNAATYFNRTFQQMDSSAADALGVNQAINRDGTVHKIYDLQSTPDEQLPKYTQPDALHNGAVAIGLGSFVQQSPALLAAVFGGIGAGAAMSAGMAADSAREEGLRMGLSGDALTQYTATNATVGLVTGGLPGVAGVGSGLALYGSRFVAGGAVNVAADYAGSWARGAILDAHGYHVQAEQARQYDAMSAAGSFFMGGLFNLAGHGSRQTEAPPERPPAGGEPTPDAPPASPDVAPIQDTNPTAEPATGEAAPTVTSEQGLRLVHGSNNPDLKLDDVQIVRANGQKQGKKGRVYGGFYGAALEDAAHAEGYAKMGGEGTPTVYDVQLKPGVKVFEKEGDITRLSQKYIDDLAAQGYGVVSGKDPRGRTEYAVIDKAAIEGLTARGRATEENINAQDTRLSQEVGKADTLSRDAALAHMVNDNLVTESAPGLATTPEAEAAHIGAMRDATNALNEGRKVDVSAHAAGHEYLVTADESTRMQATHDTLTADDVTLSTIDSTRAAAELQPMPSERTTTRSADAEIDPVMQLRAQADALAETHPEVAAQLHQEINATQAEYESTIHESEMYSVAANCALNYGA